MVTKQEEVKLIITVNHEAKKDMYALRNTKQNPEKINTPFKFIKATSVKFIEAGKFEKKFGIKQIAQCETAEYFNAPTKEFDPSKLSKINFDGDCFTDASTGQKLKGVKIIYFNEKETENREILGEIWGKIANEDVLN